MGLIRTKRPAAPDGDAPRDEDGGALRLEDVAAAELEAQELLERRREELRDAERAGSQRIAALEQELEAARRQVDEQSRALAKARATAGGERELREDLEGELAQRQHRLDRATSELEHASSALDAERTARAAAEQDLAGERSRSAELEARAADLQQQLEAAVAEREKAAAQVAAAQVPAPAKRRATQPDVDVRKAGGCAVCQHPPDVDDLDKLRSDGWIAHSGSLLCPACQADGWRFPPDATFPLRRYSDRARTDEPAAGKRPSGQPDSRSALATAASDAPTSPRARPKAGPSPLRAARDRRR